MLNLLLDPASTPARQRAHSKFTGEVEMKFQRLLKWQSALVLLAATAATPGLLQAQRDNDETSSEGKYTLASVCGHYGIVATYGANVARALGTQTVDGHGKLTGSAIVNQPGPNNTRTIVSIGLAGTYTVNAEGTGQMIVTVTLPGGGTAIVTEDFVITKTKVKDGIAIATEIQDAQEVPSAVIDESSLVVHAYSLRGTPRSCTAEK
jgi:hypothetical protein